MIPIYKNRKLVILKLFICLYDYFLAYLCGFCGSNSDLQAYTEAFHSPLHNYALFCIEN